MTDGFDGRKAWLPWIAARGHDPVDDLRGGVGAGLDPAMALRDGGRTDQFGGGAKIVDDIGFEGGLVALERPQIIGLVGDDLVGDLDLEPMASMVTMAPSSWPVSAR